MRLSRSFDASLWRTADAPRWGHEVTMRKFVVACLSAGFLLALGANAHANRLGSESTGKDWLTAPADERSGWVQRMANLFNKDAPFADALHGCLARTLGGADDAEETLVS